MQDWQHAVVMLLALVNGQFMELGVPIAASGRNVAVSREVTWLPASTQVSASRVAPPGRSDQVAQSRLMNKLPAFFQAYASGDSAVLNKCLVPGSSVTGLGGAVTFDQISALHARPGGATRQVTVTVMWQLSGQPGSAAGKTRDDIETQDDIWYVPRRRSKRQMVCKRDRCYCGGGEGSDYPRI